jgi:hypothetical protein
MWWICSRHRRGNQPRKKGRLKISSAMLKSVKNIAS